MIELKDVCFAYGQRAVLRHINLTIHQGETIVLQGPNGCGKSTLIRILNGLSYPNQGSYIFEGQKIDEKSMRNDIFAKSFHQRVGYVFQNPDVQLFCPSVEEEIAFAPMQMEFPKDEVNKRVEDCINLLGIQELRNQPPYYLSTGEKKKVAIASILAMNPKVFVLDEPLSGLDIETQEWLTQFLLQMKKSGKTMIIATHNPSFAKILADRIVCMNKEHTIENIQKVQ